MAAVLACGEGAFLTHRSAGALYGICAERRIEVGVRGRGGREPEGIRLRRRASLARREVGTARNIPIALGVGLSLPQTNHHTASAQARDARRDQAHTAAGFSRLRFTHHQVRYEGDYARGILEST
ncbi:MAG: hypothetical protein AB7T48_13155, partial [Solirubrobacterales bacterium]